MKKETKNISLCAVFTALSLLLLFMSSVFSTMSISILAICGVVTSVALTRCGYKYTMIMFLAVAVLSFFLVPDKSCVVLYAFLFGFYPILKNLFEKTGKPYISWVLKIAAANLLVFAALYVSMSFLTNVGKIIIMGHRFFFLFYNIAFIFYDICIGKMSIYVNSRCNING